MNKILFIISGTYNGGAEKRAINTSIILKEKYATKVVAFHGEKIDGVDYVFAPNHEEYKKTSFTSRIKYIRSILEKEKPDLVLSFLPNINFLTTLTLSKRKYSHIKHIVCLGHHVFHGVDKAILKYSLKRCSMIYFQTQKQREILGNYHKPYFVLPNPLFSKGENNKKTNTYKFVSAGRLVEQKDYPLLIKSFALITKEYPEATLDIYGSGELLNNLLNLIDELKMKDKITIIAYQQDFTQKLSSYDAFLFTTKDEGFPNVIAEAMTAGLPIFSTYFLTGCDELLINNKTGFVCEKRDEKSFASMVINAFKDRDNLLTISSQGKAHVDKLCDKDLFAKNFSQNIDGLLNEKD